MDALLGLLGLLGIIVGIVMLLVYLIRRKPKKRVLIILGISFIMFITGVSITPSEQTSDEVVDNNEPKGINLEDKLIEDKLKLSQQSFTEGVEFYNKNEYEKAISSFEKVIEEDTENYQEAQRYISEAKILLSQKLLEDARNYFNNENYEEAIKAAEKAVTLNTEIKEEADSLIKEATAKYEAALLEQKKKEIIEKMKQWEGTGRARVAVGSVIAMSSFSDGFMTWEPKDPDNTWYLLVSIGVYNASKSTLHVNPNYVTLICNKRAFNPDIITYSIDNYLDAIDLQPDTYTVGWLLFLVPKAETYTLVYEGIFDKTVKKEIIVTETK